MNSPDIDILAAPEATRSTMSRSNAARSNTARSIGQRPLRIVALVAATASVATIIATANAGQVQAATTHPLALGPAVTTESLNVRSAPSPRSHIVTALRGDTRLTVVGKPLNDHWQAVRVGSASGYVNTHYLRAITTVPSRTPAAVRPTTVHPVLSTTTGYASIQAASHWYRPQGVTDRGREIALEVHAAFPQIGEMGGYRSEEGSDHNTGRAIDNMLPGDYRLPAQRALGFALAEWARANAARLGITYVIWDQHIWNIARDREGWRLMPDRGSDNQNHKNHVHISFR